MFLAWRATAEALRQSFTPQNVSGSSGTSVIAHGPAVVRAIIIIITTKTLRTSSTIIITT